MLRIICREQDMTAFICGGAKESYIGYKTFDVDAPDVEQWLREYAGQSEHGYNERVIVGVEVLQSREEKKKDL